MTSELSKYLNEEQGVFLNVKQQKQSKLKTEKTDFLVLCKILSNTFI